MMKDRVVLVTGASRGIGAATAKLLARHGAAVAVNWFQSEKAANDVVAAIRSAGGKAVAVRADARDPAQAKAMVAEATKALGPVDTLVVNAAIGFPMKPFVDYDWSDFEAKLVGELGSAFHCCKAAVPSMIERKRGCIVLISSGLSRRSGAGFVAHSTAKSGSTRSADPWRSSWAPAGSGSTWWRPGSRTPTRRPTCRRSRGR